MAKLSVSLNPGLLDCASNTPQELREKLENYFIFLMPRTVVCLHHTLFNVHLHVSILCLFFSSSTLTFLSIPTMQHVIVCLILTSAVIVHHVLSLLYITDSVYNSPCTKTTSGMYLQSNTASNYKLFQIFLNYKNNSTKINYITT